MHDTNILLSVLGFGLGLALLALWVYALISAIRNERLDSTMKIVWVLVVIFVSGLGALLYLVFAPNRPSRPGREERERAELQRRQQTLAAQSRRASL